jgi:hypothetical protein
VATVGSQAVFGKPAGPVAYVAGVLAAIAAIGFLFYRVSQLDDARRGPAGFPVRPLSEL